MKNLFIILTLFFTLPATASAQKFLDKVLKGVEKTNKILDETDKMLGNDQSSSSSSRRRQSSGFQIVSPQPDIDIQFKRCVISGSTAIIDMVITNYGKDASIQLGGNSNKVFDDAGNQYPNTRVSIADGDMQDWGQALFPTEVPLKFRLEIYNVSSKAETFKRINLNIYSKSISFNEPIILTNVPITRKDNTVKIVSDDETSQTNMIPASTSEALPLTADNLAGKWKLILEKKGSEIIDCSDKKCTITFSKNGTDDQQCEIEEKFGDELNISSFIISDNKLNYFYLSASGYDSTHEYTVKLLTIKTLVISFIDNATSANTFEHEFTFNKIS